MAVTTHIQYAGNNPANDHKNDDRKIFVGGIGRASADDLKQYFSKFGLVIDVALKTDYATGAPRGFGFVLFDSEDSVSKVLKDNNHSLPNGRRIDAKSAKYRPGQEPQVKVFVGGLNPETTEEVIRSHFEQYGKVSEISIPFDKARNVRKGYCFLTFESEAACDKAVELAKQIVGGKKCDVTKALPQDKKEALKQQHGNAPWNGQDKPRQWGPQQQWGQPPQQWGQTPQQWSQPPQQQWAQPPQQWAQPQWGQPPQQQWSQPTPQPAAQPPPQHWPQQNGSYAQPAAYTAQTAYPPAQPAYNQPTYAAPQQAPPAATYAPAPTAAPVQRPPHVNGAPVPVVNTTVGYGAPTQPPVAAAPVYDYNNYGYGAAPAANYTQQAPTYQVPQQPVYGKAPPVQTVSAPQYHPYQR